MPWRLWPFSWLSTSTVRLRAWFKGSSAACGLRPDFHFSHREQSIQVLRVAMQYFRQLACARLLKSAFVRIQIRERKFHVGVVRSTLGEVLVGFDGLAIVLFMMR